MITRYVPIPKNAFEEGIELCIQNADNLLESATILHNNEHYSASSFLAIQASEEYGKALFLTDEIAEGKFTISITRWKKMYCNHTAKLRRARKGIQDKVYKITDYRVTISFDGRRGEEIPEDETIDDLTKFALKSKIESLYVDYGIIGGTDRWKSPQDNVAIIGEVDAAGAISFAENTRIAVLETKKELGLKRKP